MSCYIFTHKYRLNRDFSYMNMKPWLHSNALFYSFTQIKERLSLKWITWTNTPNPLLPDSCKYKALAFCFGYLTFYTSKEEIILFNNDDSREDYVLSFQSFLILKISRISTNLCKKCSVVRIQGKNFELWNYITKIISRHQLS